MPHPVLHPATPVPGATDRPLRRRWWSPRRLVLLGLALGLTALSTYGLLHDRGLRKLRVDPERLTLSVVERGPFQEYTSIRGVVAPRYTVYLDAAEGGQVDSLLADEGALVQRGDPILRLVSPELELLVLNQEAELARRLEEQRGARLQHDQHLLSLRQELLELEYQLATTERRYQPYASMREADRVATISRQEFERLRDELEYARRRRDLALERHAQDSLLAAVQLAQSAGTVATMERNLAAVRGRLDRLVLRAPIAGQLTVLDAHPGESRGAGQRLGQIDGLDGLKVQAGIDEYYINRVARGQQAQVEGEAAGQALVVRKVYPEVKDGRFDVDLEFVGPPPAGLRRGQTVHIRLELGEPDEAVQLARGGFYQTTGGRWAYVLDPAGHRAVKRPIRLGRQNPKVYEVLEGLEPGERVITSGYEALGEEMDVLELQ